MIKPVVQGGIRISTIEVAGGCRNSGERKRDTDGQTKQQDAFHCPLLSSLSQSTQLRQCSCRTLRVAETRQMAFSGQRPQVAPSMTYAPSETNWSAKYGCTAPSVMAALGRWARSLARQQLRAKFFVQPMTAVVATPNL